MESLLFTDLILEGYPRFEDIEYASKDQVEPKVQTECDEYYEEKGVRPMHIISRQHHVWKVCRRH